MMMMMKQMNFAHRGEVRNGSAT